MIDEGLKLNDMMKSEALNLNTASIPQAHQLNGSTSDIQNEHKDSSILTKSPLVYLQNKTLRSSTVRIQNYFQKLANLL